MLDFLINILETPAIVLGLVALIGLLLQHKSVGQVFSGTVKTALGMLVLAAGSSLIVSEILPFVDLFSQVFNLQGFATSSEAVVGQCRVQYQSSLVQVHLLWLSGSWLM